MAVSDSAAVSENPEGPISRETEASTTAADSDPRAALLLDAFQHVNDKNKDIVLEIVRRAANQYNEEEPAPAATPEPPKGPVAREVVVSVCGELEQLLRALRYLARDTQSHDTDGAEAFALTAEHLAVRGIRMADSCVEELGERPSGNFEFNVFEERRLAEAAAKKREAACNAAEH